MSSYRSFRDLDWGLLAIALTICSIGIMQIYSATHDIPIWANAWWKQVLYVAFGLVLMWFIASIDYHTLLGQIPIMYITAVILLIAVLLFGKTIAGARRWIQLPGLLLQVSEFAKLMIILLVARFLTELRRDTLEVRELLKLGALVAVPWLLVKREPDLGTALTYLPVLAVGVFLAGLRARYIVISVILLVGISWISFHHVLEDYQRARIESFLNPELDPRGSGYQVVQSKIAIGSGGMWGRGVTQGSQTQLRFLPVPHTDFVFATFGEEHGFVGVVVVLILYFWLLMQIVQNAQTAPDRAGMYICMGVAALLLFHLLVNVGMVVGLMPVTGIPLPLMSSGGSNMLSTFLMLGLVNNVRLRRFVN
ncbi:MAG TPA: rod shape-determining protein RodA [Bryobacteraceae bacterium]|nr:rod shape-determining protein RodA [Bryobacteraceae bacterium]